MTNEIIAASLNKNFESIKKVDENGVEYWAARELMPLLGYEKWQNAEEVIGRAARACVNSGQVVDNHFIGFSKMVGIGSNTIREIKDWKLVFRRRRLDAGNPIFKKISRQTMYRYERAGAYWPRGA